MANYATLKAAISAVVKENGNNEITGNLLQQQLLAIVNSLGVGYQFIGIASPDTNPGTPDQNVFYIANVPGTYTNFSNIVLKDDEISVLYWNGSWNKITVFDDTTTSIKAYIALLTGNINGCFTIANTYIKSNGVLQDVGGDNFFVTPYLPVGVGSKLVLKTTSLSEGYAYAIYDADKNVIDSAVGQGSFDGTIEITNANAAYIVMAMSKSGQQKVGLYFDTVSVTVDTRNETLKISENVVPLFSNLNKRFDLIQQTTPKNVLTDFSAFLYDQYIDGSGNIGSLDTCTIYNKFVPIPAGETKLTMAYAFQFAVAFYDENKDFIITLGGSNDYNREIDFSVYPAAKYCKFNIRKDTIPTNPSYDGIHPCYVYFGKKYDENPYIPTGVRTYGNVIKKPCDLHNKHITFFGDSITYGYSSAPVWGPITDCYAKLLCDYFNATIDNQAVSATRLASNEPSSILNKVLNYSGNPDVIFVAGGTNDYGHTQQSPIGQMGDSTYQTIYGAVELICQHLQTNFPNAKVIFITPINRTVEHAAPSINFNELRNAIWRVAVKHGFSVIDGSKLEGFPTFGESALPIRSQLLDDGLHPTDNGHVYMANYISGLF